MDTENHSEPMWMGLERNELKAITLFTYLAGLFVLAVTGTFVFSFLTTLLLGVSWFTITYIVCGKLY